MADTLEKIVRFIKSYRAFLYCIPVLVVLLFFPNLIYGIVNNQKIGTKLLEIIITLSTVVFGFLLTMLTILIQSSGKTIDLLKVTGRFKDLVYYNKEACYSSALLLLLSIIAIVFTLDGSIISEEMLRYWKGFLIIWSVNIVHLLVSTYRYVSIFYFIVQE
jgi:hypothetical protein